MLPPDKANCRSAQLSISISSLSFSSSTNCKLTQTNNLPLFASAKKAFAVESCNKQQANYWLVTRIMQRLTRFNKLLLTWLVLNACVFVACYLNYFVALKHRYLYKLLGPGLCVSRAAAMIINISLLLVWLPMCKLSVTKLAFFATTQLISVKQALSKAREKDKENEMRKFAKVNFQHSSINNNSNSNNNNKSINNAADIAMQTATSSFAFKFKHLIEKVRISVKLRALRFEARALHLIVVAADNCKYLHFVCATTISVASVVHSIAHLLNVINFSRNYNSKLATLNMAEYKNQSPLQLINSMPGITGIAMLLILFLMSLTSADFVRNSRYDLFHILHRLSIVFVVLLVLHPSSGVLKEQSNVDAHNADICNVLVNDVNVATTTTTGNKIISLFANNSNNNNNNNSYYLKDLDINHQQQQQRRRQLFRRALSLQALKSVIANSKDTNSKHLPSSSSNNNNNDKVLLQRNKTEINLIINQQSKFNNSNNNNTNSNQTNNNTKSSYLHNNNNEIKEALTTATKTKRQCIDAKPKFVTQQTLSCYVLTIGLVCYLLDLLLRRRIRTKNGVELLRAHCDASGALLELELSNNHRRFDCWMPGQFVYVNCPHISRFEWHPFTVSSMDFELRRLSLHIKTGGDWTRRLRDFLLTANNNYNDNDDINNNNNDLSNSNYNDTFSGDNYYNQWSPKLFKTKHNNSYDVLRASKQICTPIIGAAAIQMSGDETPSSLSQATRACVDASAFAVEQLSADSLNQQLNATTTTTTNSSEQHKCKDNIELSCAKLLPIKIKGLQLFVDGPFHSPFERLLEQSVSVCISNGVGWTAFSPVFKQIAIKLTEEASNCNNNCSCTNNSNNNSNSNGNKASCCCCCYLSSNANNNDNDKQSTKTVQLTTNNNNNKGYLWWNNLSNNNNKQATQIQDSYNQQHKPTINNSKLTTNGESQIAGNLMATNLYLMVIVTNVEQLLPFYKLASSYLKRAKFLNNNKNDNNDGDDNSDNGRRKSNARTMLERSKRVECVQNCCLHANQNLKTTTQNKAKDPIKQVSVFLTRVEHTDESVKEFCARENLTVTNRKFIEEGGNDDYDDNGVIEPVIIVTNTFEIRFKRPNFDQYLSRLKLKYNNTDKISIYCCGSRQVKLDIRKLCTRLNKTTNNKLCKDFKQSIKSKNKPKFTYHEEDF